MCGGTAHLQHVFVTWSVHTLLPRCPASLAPLHTHSSTYFQLAEFRDDSDMHTPCSPPVRAHFQLPEFRASKAMRTPVNTALGSHPALSTLCAHTSNYLSSGPMKPCTHHIAPLYSHSSTHFQLPEFWTNEAMHTPLNTALGDHHPALFPCAHTAAHTSNWPNSGLTMTCTHHLTLCTG